MTSEPVNPRESKFTKQSRAIREHLTEHSIDGVSTVGWKETANKFGVSREWVRRLAIKLGIVAKPVRPFVTATCPDCGRERRLSPGARPAKVANRRCYSCAKKAWQPEAEVVKLRCSYCSKEFERQGLPLYMWKKRVREQAPSVVICPTCFESGVRSTKGLHRERQQSSAPSADAPKLAD